MFKSTLMTDSLREIGGRNFFFLLDWDVIAPGYEELLNAVTPGFRSIALAFQRNLTGAASIASFPFHMTHTAVAAQRFQAHHTAERILLGVGEDLWQDGAMPDWAEQEASRRAHLKMDEEMRDNSAQELLVTEVLSRLGGLLDDANMKVACNEILRQACVLTWGSFEVFVRDFFVTLMNDQPQLAMTLQRDEATRTMFRLKAIPLDMLAEYGFDVSGKVGELLIRQDDIASMPRIKSTFRVLFPNKEELHAALASRDLWLLSQRRHLLVHNRGIIDEAYKQRTGEDLCVGSDLVIVPHDLRRYMRASCKAVMCLLDAVVGMSKTLPGGRP